MKKGIVAIKHKAVLDNLVKNVGKKGKATTMVKAMTDLGYSKSYAENGNIKKSKTWGEIMEQYLPDDILAEKHRELLEAKEFAYFVFPKKMKDEDIIARVEEAGQKVVVIRDSQMGKMAFYAVDNTRAKKDAIDLAYKIKGKNAPEKFEVENTGLQSLSDAELMALINKQKARFNKTD